MSHRHSPLAGILGLAVAGSAGAGTITVPSGQAPTIQVAINITNDLDADVPDEVVVLPGTYFESINLTGKALHLRSSGGPDVTIIDALGQLDQAVHCITLEGPDTIIEGFTIRNGDGTHAFPDDRGGGLYVNQSSPTVRDCVFIMNEATFGGAVYSNSGSPTFEGCRFEDNLSNTEGGAAYLNSSDGTTFTDCMFLANEAAINGGAVSNRHSQLAVWRSEFRGNIAVNGDGLYNVDADSVATVINGLFDAQDQALYNGGSATSNLWNCTSTDSLINTSSGTLNVTNCIVWNGSISTGGTETVSYSVVQGGYVGTGNLDPAGGPMFVDLVNGDLRILDTSPAVDAGNSLAAVNVFGQYPTDLAGDPRGVNAPAVDAGKAVYGVTIDIGAYEIQAAVTGSCPWDTSGDGEVGIQDFLGLLQNWGNCP